MLDELVNTIETLKQRIRDHGNDIADYESRTRVTLIDPMLRALGWDVSDPSVVQIEPKVENGWADYALLGGNRRAVVFVEAKKLSHRESPIGQIIQYAGVENYKNQANITYCVYTNGDTWEVVNVREQQPVMTVSIATEDSAKCALKFLSLWRQSMADGIFDTAVEPVVEIDPPPVKPEPPEPPAPPSPTQPIGPEWTALTEEFESTGKPAPLGIRLPDGQVHTTRSWTGVVIQTALWLFQSRELTKENCRIKAGRSPSVKRYILSDDGKHSTGTPFHSPAPIPTTGIIMESSFNPNDLVRNAQILLEHFGRDPSQVFLKLQ